jgi:phosphopentomutase
LFVPHLDALGLGAAIRLSTGIETPGLAADPTGRWGIAREVSRGKDTPSGHWELAGVPVPWDWHFFPDTQPAFSSDLMAALAHAAGTGGTLANCHASGTQVIDDFGAEHQRTGWPICYTSADSVLQIAAHEEVFGLERLFTMCKTLAPMLHDMRVGRVIARPFVGSETDGFQRTTNRKDFAIEPPAPTLCDWVQGAGRRVQAVGKIGDIFSMRGIDELHKGSDAQLMTYLGNLVDHAPEGSLTFANFVEFDTQYGHRRDVSGYARALEWFDDCLPDLFARSRPDDMFVFTADHGNDPTWIGTDHTREQVPVVVRGCGQGQIGQCGFVDVAASVAAHLGVPAQGSGKNFIADPT